MKTFNEQFSYKFPSVAAFNFLIKIFSTRLYTLAKATATSRHAVSARGFN